MQNNRLSDLDWGEYEIEDDVIGPECPLTLPEINVALFPLMGEDIIDLVWDVKRKIYIFKLKDAYKNSQ